MAQLQFITRAYFSANRKSCKEHDTRERTRQSVLCGGATPNKSTASESETTWRRGAPGVGAGSFGSLQHGGYISVWACSVISLCAFVTTGKLRTRKNKTWKMAKMGKVEKDNKSCHVCVILGASAFSLFFILIRFVYSTISASLALRLPAYEPQNAALPNKSILFMQNEHAKGFPCRCSCGPLFPFFQSYRYVLELVLLGFLPVLQHLALKAAPISLRDR